jgi:hypothetical protein
LVGEKKNFCVVCILYEQVLMVMKTGGALSLEVRETMTEYGKMQLRKGYK